MARQSPKSSESFVKEMIQNICTDGMLSQLRGVSCPASVCLHLLQPLLHGACGRDQGLRVARNVGSFKIRAAHADWDISLRARMSGRQLDSFGAAQRYWYSNFANRDARWTLRRRDEYGFFDVRISSMMLEKSKCLSLAPLWKCAIQSNQATLFPKKLTEEAPSILEQKQQTLLFQRSTPCMRSDDLRTGRQPRIWSCRWRPRMFPIF
eukprot:472151-Pleurochrysis_carterae.AAC.2